MILVVLSIHLEDLWIMSQFLFIRDPRLIKGALLMIWVLQVEVHRAYIVVVNSVFDVIEVLVSHGHANLSQFVDQLLLGVLLLVAQQLVTVVDDLSEGLLCLVFIDLSQLLHLLVVLADEMLFFLGQVS